jgi:hypothetical protein
MLIVGDATEGMTKAIYDALKQDLEDSLKNLTAEQRAPIEENWKKMSHAIAKGVIDHIKSNMEINGVQTKGNISASVSGGVATQVGVVFTQSNDGAGRVR